MSTVLNKIDELIAMLKDLLPMKPENSRRLNHKFRLEFNYNSNHLEGNTLTYGETELLLIFDDTKGDHTMREYEEMKAHDVAYGLIEDWANDEERPLTEGQIKNLNKILLVRPFYKDAITPEGQSTRRLIKVGDYKEYPNSVRLANGEIFEYALPIDTPILMQELISWYREAEIENSIHPVALAAMLHYRFVRIHPFDDGNGRTARLLLNYVLLKHNLPPVIIKSDDKSNYLRALNRADNGNIEELINYVAEQAVWSLELSIKAARGEAIEEEEDWKKQLKMMRNELQDKDEIKVKKSEKVVTELLTTTILPLSQKLTSELNEYFADLFFDTHSYLINGTNAYTLFSNNAIQVVNDKIDQFLIYTAIRMNLNTFKKNGNNPFDLSTDLVLEFDEYEYVLVLPSVKIRKFYHHAIDEQEYKVLFNAWGQQILKSIQEKLTGA